MADEEGVAKMVTAKVQALLAEVELDTAGETRAAIAVALAQKLDDALISDSGAVAMAIAGISKELRSVLDSILEDTAADDQFVADLYAEVGDS